MVNRIYDHLFTNISADTASFTLRGGLYGMQVNATWGGGSVSLKRLGPDGITYVTMFTAFTADGYVSVNLPNGTYKVGVTTATGVYAEITSIAQAI